MNMPDEIVNENTPDNQNIKTKINNFMKDPLKLYGFSFLFFALLTLIFYFAAGPDFLKFGSFIIAVFTGIMCRQQVKTEMRMYNDR